MSDSDSALFAPACSITQTKRRRFFWAAWWTGAPTRVPFKKPDASGGGEASFDLALATAEARAGQRLVVIDPLWARACIRQMRGEPLWPSRASREPRTKKPARSDSTSIWTTLGVERSATDEELKAAYRKRVLEAHPDQGGDDATFQRVVRAYQEAQRRRRKKPV